MRLVTWRDLGVSVIWNDVFGTTLFVKGNIGFTFLYLNFQLLLLVDVACLIGSILRLDGSI